MSLTPTMGMGMGMRSIATTGTSTSTSNPLRWTILQSLARCHTGTGTGTGANSILLPTPPRQCQRHPGMGTTHRTFRYRCASFSTSAPSTTNNLNSNSNSNSNSNLTLYQYAICPYCNIAKALLNFTNTPFQAKEVNPLTKAEIKSLPDKEYKKVPILMVGDQQQVNGSESIVDHILTSSSSESSSSSSSSIDSSSPSAQQWTHFGREELAPLLYPNLCNTLANSYQAFGYVHAPGTPFSLVQRYSIQGLGSIAMYLAASKIKKKRNITDERAALMEALQQLDQELTSLPGKQFLSGTETPHLGDLTVYGVLRGLKGLNVMDTVHQAYPSIQQWYDRMEQRVEEAKC